MAFAVHGAVALACGAGERRSRLARWVWPDVVVVDARAQTESTAAEREHRCFDVRTEATAAERSGHEHWCLVAQETELFLREHWGLVDPTEATAAER